MLYLSVVIAGFGDVPLRENFSGIFVLPRAGSIPENCIFHDGAQPLHHWWSHGPLQTVLSSIVLLPV